MNIMMDGSGELGGVISDSCNYYFDRRIDRLLERFNLRLDEVIAWITQARQRLVDFYETQDESNKKSYHDLDIRTDKGYEYYLLEMELLGNRRHQKQDEFNITVGEY